MKDYKLNMNIVQIIEQAYFLKHYKRKNVENNTLCKKTHHALNEEEKEVCDGLLTEYECGLALKEMQNNKSSGSDSITNKCYQIFWNDIQTYLTNSLNYSFI